MPGHQHHTPAHLLPISSVQHSALAFLGELPGAKPATLHSPTSKHEKATLFLILHNIMASYLSSAKAQTCPGSACMVSLLSPRPSLTQKEIRKPGIT